MIFAAGLGTRLRPLTDTMPKALVSVGGEPLLKRVVLRLRDAGFTRIVVNVHHFSEQITDYLSSNNNFGLDIRISDETDALLDHCLTRTVRFSYITWTFLATSILPSSMNKDKTLMPLCS